MSVFTLKDCTLELPTAKLPKLDFKFGSTKPVARGDLGWTPDRIKNQLRARIWGDVWDAYKMIINPYWMVNPTAGEIAAVARHTGVTVRPISNKQVISRAYHKMLEILYAFPLLPAVPDSKRKPLAIACVAEAPGGFIQAITEYAGLKSPDRVVGMSILDESKTEVKSSKNEILGLHKNEILGLHKNEILGLHKNEILGLHKNEILGLHKISGNRIPEFKFDNEVFTAFYGADKTGNVCVVENITAFAKQFPSGADLATADGGFEILDWLLKEARVAHLFWSESMAAYSVLNVGRGFVCKLYSLYTLPTAQIIYVQCALYDRVSLCKPPTSRITNTENYIVCEGFRGRDPSVQAILWAAKAQMTTADPNCGALESSPMLQTLGFELPTDFTAAIHKYNTTVEDIREDVAKRGYELVVSTNHHRDKKQIIQAIIDTNAAVSREWLARHFVG